MIYICTGEPTSGDGDDDSDIGTIVGGVIGGTVSVILIVILILIIAVAYWMCRSKDVYNTIRKYKLCTYRIRTNIGGYNIWHFVEIMDLARCKFGEIIQKQLGSQLIYAIEKIGEI